MFLTINPLEDWNRIIPLFEDESESEDDEEGEGVDDDDGEGLDDDDAEWFLKEDDISDSDIEQLDVTGQFK